MTLIIVLVIWVIFSIIIGVKGWRSLNHIDKFLRDLEDHR